MKKFTYYKSACFNDSEVFSVREKRKWEVVKELEEKDLKKGPDGEWYKVHVCGTLFQMPEYGKVEKVTVQYTDTMDLVKELMGEGGGGMF